MKIRKSLTELALKSKKALVVGAGGGGDVIMTIPVANYLRLIGVETVMVGGVGCSWWVPGSAVSPRGPEEMVFGATVYDVMSLSPIEQLAPQIVRVGRETHINGKQPAEAILMEQFGTQPLILGLTGGVAGLRDSLRQLVANLGIDLIVAMDIGGDVFHDGKEIMKAHSSLVDYIAIAALTQLDIPVVFGLIAQGADGEMQPEELDQRISRVMRAGGYLGALGPTQRDVADMLACCALYPDPISPLAPRAAQGEFGLMKVRTYGPWGTIVRLGPAAATIMLFDPHVMIEVACTGASKLRETTSIAEAEQIYANDLEEYPETWWEPVVRFRRPIA